MKNIGIELEFFVKEIKSGQIVPAYKATLNLDGNPFIGELKTKVHTNEYNLIYELKSIIHRESDLLKSKGYELLLIPEVVISKDEFKSLRRDSLYVNKKELEVLDEISVYNKNTGKILSPNKFKASLQVNISSNKVEKISIDGKIKEIYSSNVFNFNPIIKSFDDEFKQEINSSGRVSGVYAIKDGQFGKRVEYRSLPNNIDLNKLMYFISNIIL